MCEYTWDGLSSEEAPGKGFTVGRVNTHFSTCVCFQWLNERQYNMWMELVVCGVNVAL